MLDLHVIRHIACIYYTYIIHLVMHVISTMLIKKKCMSRFILRQDKIEKYTVSVFL